ncbi:hypothetical protein [Komagataeibacter xylinus]|uniref:hypothetical protein n=1 Tax=Komagataeibacter xylinus TaxID=28448 RepID=UPI0010316F76|nr:hypothetical protein [Komagataeibacter xylinus]
MKLFSKSFEECSLFENRLHPETFMAFYPASFPDSASVRKNFSPSRPLGHLRGAEAPCGVMAVLLPALG